MNTQYTLVKQQIEYGLDRVDPNHSVEVNLRELLYVHQTISELVRFFHQPDHCQTLEQVDTFMGNSLAGAFHHICESRTKLGDMLPADIDEAFSNGMFDNPKMPYYYAVDSSAAFNSATLEAGEIRPKSYDR